MASGRSREHTQGVEEELLAPAPVCRRILVSTGALS
jgi:hypothetical protein